MRDDQASRTAGLVAAWRGLAGLLPDAARLCHDPFGTRFAGRFAEALGHAAERAPEAARRLVAALPVINRGLLFMQVRTRVIDDALLDFVRAGGRQVILLGAGFDCRAHRFRAELGDTVVFEVDHPATQARKRQVLRELGVAEALVRYLAWDFEKQPLPELEGHLERLGHDRGRPTLTIWEGVTPYLDQAAILATIDALSALSAPSSRLAVTYFERRAVEHPSPAERMIIQLVKRLGEPFRSGIDARELGAWLVQRGFAVVDDADMCEVARRYLPERYARWIDLPGRRIAVARRT